MNQYEQGVELAKQFNWHSPSWDLFIILFWLVASLLYTIASGRGRLMSILVSTYMAKLLVLEAPFLQMAVNQKLTIQTQSLQQLATFGAVFMLLFFVLSKYAFRSSADAKGGGVLIFGTLFSLTQVGLLINIAMSYLPKPVLESFSPLIKYLFIGQTQNFVWLILPVLFLVVLGRFLSHHSDH